MKGTAALRRQILARSARIAVLGQGYVGLSLACVAAEAGFPVTGIDIDKGRVDALRAGGTVAGVAQDAARPPSDWPAVFTSDASAVAAPAWFSSACRRRCATAAPTCRSSTGGRERRSAPAARGPRGPRVDDLPGHHRGAVAPRSSRGPGLAAGRGLLPRVLARAHRPRQPELAFREPHAWSRHRRPRPPGSRLAFYEQLVDKVVPVSSAGRPSWSSCSRTRSAT